MSPHGYKGAPKRSAEKLSSCTHRKEPSGQRPRANFRPVRQEGGVHRRERRFTGGVHRFWVRLTTSCDLKYLNGGCRPHTPRLRRGSSFGAAFSPLVPRSVHSTPKAPPRLAKSPSSPVRYFSLLFGVILLFSEKLHIRVQLFCFFRL